MKEIIFYYDVVCPFAYMASRLVEGVAARAGARVKWTPVLLGGLYEATDAPQGKHGSASSVMAPAKKAIVGADLQTQLQRYRIPLNYPASHPQRTLNAMRLLAISPAGRAASGDQRQAALDNSVRRSLSDALYRAYWVDDCDLTDQKVLTDVVKKVGWSVDVKDVLDSSTPLGGQAKSQLEANTKEAAERGAFGVPSFWANDRLYWGVDRMCLVETDLSGQKADMLRLAKVPLDAAERPVQKLTVYFDFSSPWTFLGVSQVSALVESLRPLRITVEWVPILLGAVFKAIGTPVVPMAALSPAKATYASQDLHDWVKYRDTTLVYPSNFPLRTVLPLRVYLAQPDDRLRTAVFTAAWQHDIDVGNPEELAGVLTEAGYDAKALIAKASDPDIKDMLKQTTARGIEAGICGAPSFQVDGGPVVFGQDRLPLVADLLCGWAPPATHVTPKL